MKDCLQNLPGLSGRQDNGPRLNTELTNRLDITCLIALNKITYDWSIEAKNK